MSDLVCEKTVLLHPVGLDSISMADLEAWEDQKEKVLRYHWDLYCALAYERGKIEDQLKEALLSAAEQPFTFSGWQRQVLYKYALTPLSSRGSLIEPGGRFNIPEITGQIPAFPALYIAEDRETTLQEAGQGGAGHGGAGQGGAGQAPLSPLEVALIRKDSIAIVSVKGKLGSVIDLQQPRTLKRFLNLVKDFPIPKSLLEEAQKLGQPLSMRYNNLNALIKKLLEPNWRAMPMQCDVPAACQIFGQMISQAGIEGLLYPSKFTGKRCLAVYPHNLKSDSFVAVEGDYPPEATTRLGRSNQGLGTP